MAVKLNILKEENVELKSQLDIAQKQLMKHKKIVENYMELKAKERHDFTEV